jgi:hypothetical protein
MMYYVLSDSPLRSLPTILTHYARLRLILIYNVVGCKSQIKYEVAYRQATPIHSSEISSAHCSLAYSFAKFPTCL